MIKFNHHNVTDKSLLAENMKWPVHRLYMKEIMSLKKYEFLDRLKKTY